MTAAKKDAYYNEFDPYAAQWLRNLIAAGHIAPGVVDERSIADVAPQDVAEFTQCHWFAGIGVWSFALRNAGWEDTRPVWTGSCPCQPFSAAGAGAGFDDERHLWPAFQWHIAQRRPSIVLGEQVSSKAAGLWLDLVQTDMEALDYRFGALAFPAASSGAPHIRDRCYWVGYTSEQGLEECIGNGSLVGGQAGTQSRQAAERAGIHTMRMAHTQSDRHERTGQLGESARRDGAAHLRAVDRLAHTHGRHASTEREQSSWQQRFLAQDSGRGVLALERIANAVEWLAHTPGAGQLRRRTSETGDGRNATWLELERLRPAGDGRRNPGPTNGFWADADWLLCRDGKWRPVEPGTFPLVTRAAEGMVRVRADLGHRAGRLKGYGNAINAAAAQAFIETVMEYRP